MFNVLLVAAFWIGLFVVAGLIFQLFLFVLAGLFQIAFNAIMLITKKNREKEAEKLMIERARKFTSAMIESLKAESTELMTNKNSELAYKSAVKNVSKSKKVSKK